MTHYTASLSARDGMIPTAPAAAGLRVFTRMLDCPTTSRLQIFNISQRITEVIQESGIRDGLLHVQALHTTAAVILNECQEALLRDFESMLALFIDEGIPWRHNDPRYSDCDRRNAAAHLRGLFLGHSLTLQVRNGKPVLGRWQAVLLVELDGPQARQLSAQVTGI